MLTAARAGRTIDKIITIATPYRGSLKAIEALLPGARNLFGFENQKSMRHAARTMPGVYQLLPTWPEAVVRQSDGKPLDIFNPRTWQSNLLKSLHERFDGPRFFARMLSDAKAFTSTGSAPWPTGLRRRVYTAYGVKTKTWFQVPVDTTKGNFFRFDEVRTDSHDAKFPHGDGTVHTVSSIRPEIARTALRRKTDERQRFRDAIVGHHANMPNHGGVQDWALGLLNLNEHHGATFESPV